MAKEYFPHDYSARSTLREVRKDFGLEGIGCYWCLVEILHEEGGYIKESELESVAYELRVDVKVVDGVVRNYGLFSIKKGKVTSDRVLRNLQKRAEISEARKTAAESRWGKKDDEIEEAEMPPEEEGLDRESAKQFYIAAIQQRFEAWLEAQDTDTLLSGGRNIYDYKNLFDNIINEVKTKDYVIIGRKNVPVYKFLQVVGGHVKMNGEIRNLEQAIRDVERRYVQGKVKNKTNYLIAALYNAALVDNL